MVVTCPQCSKRYMLDDALLPAEGRQVRCIACDHIWKQNPELNMHNHVSSLMPEIDGGAQIDASPDRRSFLIGGIISIFLLILLMSSLIFGRNFIVSQWPEMEKYYELIGFQLNIPGSGLSFANTTSQVHRDGTTEMIRVLGSIINTSNSVRYIPPLKITLVGDLSHSNCIEKDKNKECVLDRWEHRLSEQSLLPGEKIRFETNPRRKIDGTKHIYLEF